MSKKITIIGGGPGGYVAAIRAAQLGCDVTLIEKENIGGTCLNWGCIPTKALYKNAEVLHTIKNSSEFGIEIDGYTVDVEKIQSRKQDVVNKLVGGINQLLKANKVQVIKGLAEFETKTSLKIKSDNEEIIHNSDYTIIATGSYPSSPPIEGINLPGVITSNELLNFKEIPEKLVIIGGGVIGMEFAGIFANLGSKVTVIEFLPSILSTVDSDITKRLVPMLKKKGIDIITSTKVIKLEKSNDILIIHGEGPKGVVSFEATQVLVAVGRAPNINDLNLDKVDISHNKKGISVNENYETNVKNIYAIGDVNGISLLAHSASHQGISAVENIMGIHSSNHDAPVPGCIFITPEIATVGITEDEAKSSGIEYKTSKFMFGANGKALSMGEGEGFVKVLCDKNNIIIGVHIMGPQASSLIHEGVLAVSCKLSVDDIKTTIHAHPTLAESFHEAVLGLAGEAIHMAPVNK